MERMNLPLAAFARPLLSAVLGLGLAASCSAEEPLARQAMGDAEVAAALAAAFEDSHVPGGVAAIARFGEPARIGSFGMRKAGTEEPFLPDDLVHIGSCTKAMTAVTLTRLARDGRIEWGTTLAEALPELAAGGDPAYAGVTLGHLLTHTSGLPANALFWGAHADEPLRERRRRIIAAMLRVAPDAQPGEAFLYSNLGYVVAGCFAEAATGEEFEDLIRAEVAAPLGLETLGFGPPGTEGEVDQPWGHRVSGDGARPSQADNPAAIGPAGTVHLGLADWARFALAFTDAAVDAEGSLITRAERERLLAPALDSYACGWRVVERDWAGGRAIAHSGSNTRWFATVWVAPSRGRAYLAAVNASGDSVPPQMDRAIGALIQLDAARDAREAGDGDGELDADVDPDAGGDPGENGGVDGGRPERTGR